MKERVSFDIFGVAPKHEMTVTACRRRTTAYAVAGRLLVWYVVLAVSLGRETPLLIFEQSEHEVDSDIRDGGQWDAVTHWAG